jgi:phytoene desaturase
MTSKGQQLNADLVASNADVIHTYKKMLGHHVHGIVESNRLKKKRHSMSLFVVYFGLRQRPEEQNLQHHTICFGNRYRGLIDELFSGPGVPEDFSLYLHSPCVTDPSLAPEGCSAHYVLSPVPHLGNAPVDWSIEGPKYRDRILAYLEKHYLPNLNRDLVTTRIFTPDDFRSELNAHVGSAFSLEPILTQSAWFRPHNRDAAIPNLYLVGAGTHPGAGVPGVVGSAKATASVILEDLGAPA